MPSKVIVKGIEDPTDNNNKEDEGEVKCPCVECGKESGFKSKTNGECICLLHKLLLHHFAGCEVEELQDAPSPEDQLTQTASQMVAY